MRYEFLLFDLDNTLLDFDAGEKEALHNLFCAHGIPVTEPLLAHYHTVNHALWREYEKGTRTIDQVLNTRFSLTMRAFGKEISGEDWEREYRVYLGEEHALIPGAKEVCERLAPTRRMYIITNGIRDTQIRRLQDAGLFSCFQRIFNSESIGFQKPHLSFFTYVMTHIEGFDQRRALVIGDSQASDIAGGQGAGLDTCWFNKYGVSDTASITADYKIDHLTELLKIV
mgnify:FL=1